MAGYCQVHNNISQYILSSNSFGILQIMDLQNNMVKMTAIFPEPMCEIAILRNGGCKNWLQFGTRSRGWPRHGACVVPQVPWMYGGVAISILPRSFRSEQLKHAICTVFEAELSLPLIDVASFKSTRSFPESMSPCMRDDVTRVDTCKQSRPRQTSA